MSAWSLTAVRDGACTFTRHACRHYLEDAPPSKRMPIVAHCKLPGHAVLPVPTAHFHCPEDQSFDELLSKVQAGEIGNVPWEQRQPKAVARQAGLPVLDCSIRLFCFCMTPLRFTLFCPARMLPADNRFWGSMK